MTLSLSSLQISPLSNIFPPSSQKAASRPISFLLVDNTTGSGTTSSLSLNIRPEELTRSEASRATVQQTLGGGWVDDFGPGLATINISGTTGWRGTVAADGIALFAQLKQQVYTDWHARRNAARASGIDPNLVTLTFADALDSTTDVVVPLNFTLRRSRSRPLLMQYQIQMVSLGLPPPATTSSSPFASALSALGLTSLASAVQSISSAISQAASWVQTNILGPVTSFMTMAATAFNAVIGVINSATSIVSSVISTAQSIARCGVNVLQTLSSIASLPAAISTQIVATAGAFTNVLCVLKNAVGSAGTYPDFSTLLGASNCSSTAGGSPPSQYTLNGTNPFNDVIGPAIAPPIIVSAQAQSSMQLINNSDPVLSPLTPALIGSNLNVINGGVQVAA